MTLKTALIFAFLFVRTVFANIAEPPKPYKGNITGESFFKHLKVIREDLTIRMFRVPMGAPIQVTAKYIIDCPYLLKDVELVFVANGLTEGRYLVHLDGKFLNGYLTNFDSVPASWLPPDSIKFQNKHIPYVYTHEGLIRFRFDSLSPGQHTLEVDYDANASEWFQHGDLSVTRTFVYILRPTESWKSFENFHLEIFPPDDWEFTSNLDLKQKDRYTWSGDWAKLPADYLSIAIRKPSAKTSVLSILFITLSGLAFIVLSVFWMARLTRYRIRKNKPRFIQTLNSILISFLATFFFYFIFYINFDLMEELLSYEFNPLTDYGASYSIYGFPFLWVLMAIIVFIIDHMLTRRLRKKYTTVVAP
jgi:hypothetical protein